MLDLKSFKCLLIKIVLYFLRSETVHANTYVCMYACMYVCVVNEIYEFTEYVLFIVISSRK